MPCQGCGTSSSGKTRCVVCDAKWCNSCISSGAEKRSSGWKCNGCVGTASKRGQKVDYMTQKKEEVERNKILREEGFFV